MIYYNGFIVLVNLIDVICLFLAYSTDQVYRKSNTVKDHLCLFDKVFFTLSCRVIIIKNLKKINFNCDIFAKILIDNCPNIRKLFNVFNPIIHNWRPPRKSGLNPKFTTKVIRCVIIQSPQWPPIHHQSPDWSFQIFMYICTNGALRV